MEFYNRLKNQIQEKEKLKNLNKSLEDKYYTDIVLKTAENEEKVEKIKNEIKKKKFIEDKNQVLKVYEGICLEKFTFLIFKFFFQSQFLIFLYRIVKEKKRECTPRKIS